MNLISFDNLEVIKTRGYGGLTGSKRAVIYNNCVWMLKVQQNLKNRNLNNVELSYANDVISEYIGCSIYSLVGLPVQPVLLGTYNNKLAVLCGDIAYPSNIIEFRTVRNMIMDEGVVQHSSGMSTNLSDIFEVIEYCDIEDKESIIQRFWDMFLIDVVIGNTDRNNGNWGFIEQDNQLVLAPIYDCGGCLNNKRSDKRMLDDLIMNNIDSVALNYTFNYRDINGKRINPYEYISNNTNQHIMKSAAMLYSLRVGTWRDVLDNLKPIISDIRIEWYKRVIDTRINKLSEIFGIGVY